MNGIKTFILIMAMTALLVWIGDLLYGESGVILALALSIVLNGVSYFFSDRIVLAAYGAQLVNPAQAPELCAIVANLAQRAGLPLPRVAIIADETPNAFATGRDPDHAVVAVTEGLLATMSRQELEGVLGHELGHVKHRDILIGSLCAVLAQAIMLLSRMAFFIRPRDDREGGNPFAAILVMQMAVSRSREYEADDYSAHLTGRPDQLASALKRIESLNRMSPMRDAQPATAHMMIINPLRGGGILELFSTHPPVAKRIARLDAMSIQMR
jgi:heat shock protein HtpX